MKINSQTIRESLLNEREVEYKDELSKKRIWTVIIMILTASFVLYVYIHGSLIDEASMSSNFREKLMGPSISHIFGTDHAGRDMYLRTVKGLSTSLKVGFIGTISSFLISIIFCVLLVVGKEKTDFVVNFLIDGFLSVPHMMFLILISVAVGRGIRGVIIGLALTHWTGLTRILRSEILELMDENYIHISKAMGKSNFYIFKNHILPHLLPQIVVGLMLLFPHAILHEAGITFLGFGLSLSTPAIGIILQESMKYISTGHVYLALLPGLMLVLLVLCINSLGENLKSFLDPNEIHR
ncbi:ABC transporter permease [Anaerococcus sp. mt242]|uniref:ABC transporter permease n=1 Tax=Anaerococcus sp. mt242 TaxID=2661917 RepID=UPI00193186C3|nr:ABC transporter permease [Anaerococcus sp. mt242]MBM0046465.1 ABC transporter permease [Anaerococcus sp. mt242]